MKLRSLVTTTINRLHSSLVLPLLLLLGLVLVLSPYPLSAEGADTDETQDVVVRSAEEAYRQDAKAYVEAYGGTIDDAVRKLKLQDEVNAINGRLQTQEADTFAGLWIEHEPQFGVVVLFTTPNGEELLSPYIQSGPLAGLVETRTAARSLAELNAIQ